jgi:hypothetical protein
MATFARAHTGPAYVGLESFSAVRTPETQKSELALTSLVIVALVAGVAIVSIVALAKQAQHANAAMLVNARAVVHADETGMLNTYNKAEAEVLDRDLYPFCLNVGDSRLPSLKQTLGQDHRPFRAAAGRVVAQEVAAAAKDGQATAAHFMDPRPAADAASRPKVAFVTGISDLGCGAGNYK